MLINHRIYLFAVCMVVLSSYCAFAQESTVNTVEVKWREAFVTVENTRMEVPSVKGYTLGVMEQRGFAFYENDEVATINAWLTYESKGRDAVYRGYLLYTFRDGATQVAHFDGAGDVVGTQRGTFTFIKGTGRFEGIQGGGTFTAEGFPPKADLYVDAQGKYTLPKK